MVCTSRGVSCIWHAWGVNDHRPKAKAGSINPTYDVLDGMLVLLARSDAAGLTPLTTTGPDGRALIAFTSEACAEQHHANLPKAMQAHYNITVTPPWDDRAKTEWLQAAKQIGCVRLDVNPNQTLEPHAALPLNKALAYMHSKQTGSACL